MYKNRPCVSNLYHRTYFKSQDWKRFFFVRCSFQPIRKPQPLIIRDCGTHFTLNLIQIYQLFDDSSHTTRTNSSTTLTVFCGGNQGDFAWFIGHFRWFFLWYSPCIWRFTHFCYHGVITEQIASVSLLMHFSHIEVHLYKFPYHCLGNSFFKPF